MHFKLSGTFFYIWNEMVQSQQQIVRRGWVPDVHITIKTEGNGQCSVFPLYKIIWSVKDFYMKWCCFCFMKSYFCVYIYFLGLQSFCITFSTPISTDGDVAHVLAPSRRVLVLVECTGLSPSCMDSANSSHHPIMLNFVNQAKSHIIWGPQRKLSSKTISIYS